MGERKIETEKGLGVRESKVYREKNKKRDMLGERGRATESEKKVEVGWERDKDTKRDRVGERVKDR